MDGTVLHGLSLIYILRDLPAVQAFKVIQESVELTRVMVVPGTSFTDQDEAEIVKGFRSRLGGAVRVAVERVEQIPAERSGKFRYIVSHVGTGTNVSQGPS